MRAVVSLSGGTQGAVDFSGQFSFPFSQAYAAAHGVAPASTVFAQWWSRDPGFGPPNNVSLMDGLAFFWMP